MKKSFSFYLVIFLMLLSPLTPQEKKLRVVAEKASIYLEPEKDSTVVGIVEKGNFLTLLSDKKIRDYWYYVSFRSEDSFITVSGFIYASTVEELLESSDKSKKAKMEKQEAVKEPEEIVYEIPLKIQVGLENANVRSKPNFEAEIIQQVESGITLLTALKVGEWYRVELPPDEEGIIVSGYIHQSTVQEIREKKT